MLFYSSFISKFDVAKDWLIRKCGGGLGHAFASRLQVGMIG